MQDRTGITVEQYEQLLRNLNSSRVASRTQAGRSLSYLEAWDVKAHLIRIFGFGGWSSDVIESALAYEEKNEKGQWSVGYKVTLRLTIHNVRYWQETPNVDTTYTESAVGSASLPQRGEAHDMAIKTAESDALKRAAINLGTQFGLSLYDNGSRKDVVGLTLVPPAGYTKPATTTVEVDPEPSVEPRLDPEKAMDTIAKINECTDEEALKAIYDLAVADGWVKLPWDDGGDTIHDFVVARLQELRA